MPPTGGARFDATVPANGTPGGYSYIGPNGPIPAHRPGAPNPWLAGALGLIPGVGAMYNEQYAKGIIHLVVFAVLVSLTDSHGIFGLFVAGWVFYMAIEAYHSAAARRDGRPLPNPFGLNDIGERLGFGKAWSGHHPAAAAPNPYAAATDTGTPPYTHAPGYAPPVGGAVPSTAAWAVPPPPNYAAGYQPGYYPPPSIPPLPFDEQPHVGNRFPIGAIWLIVLGALFLIANSGLFHGLSGKYVVPVLFFALAAWSFTNRMTNSSSYSEYGAPGYQLRLYRAVSTAVWLALVGLLFLLDDLNILSWAHSWPLFIILAGVIAVFKRTAYSAAATVPYNPQYPYGAPTPPPTEPAAPAPAASSVPPASDPDINNSHDSYNQEGR